MTEAQAKPRSETARALSGAWRFCRFDPAAVEDFDPGVGAMLRSFLTAFYGLPFYAGLLALDVWTTTKPPSDLWTYALVQLGVYAFHIAAFPLAVFGMMRALGPVKGMPLFVTAQNWIGLLQAAGSLYFIVIDRSGVLGSIGLGLLLLFQLYSLAVEAYIAMVTLGEAALAGCAIVLLDIVIGTALDQLVVTQFP